MYSQFVLETYGAGRDGSTIPSDICSICGYCDDPESFRNDEDGDHLCPRCEGECQRCKGRGRVRDLDSHGFCQTCSFADPNDDELLALIEDEYESIKNSDLWHALESNAAIDQLAVERATKRLDAERFSN